MSVLNNENINNENKLVVCDFFAQWCGPCKMQAPIIERLEEKYLNKLDKVVFKKIDIDIQQELAQAYNIMSIPTIIFLYNNQEIHERLTLCSIIDKLLEEINK